MKKKIDIKKLKIKAKKGNLKAIKELGFIYYFGDIKEGKDANAITPKDAKEAVKWWQIGASKKDPDCLVNLGFCYHMGDGVNQNNTEARKCWEQASSKGSSGANFNLGIFYEAGWSVEKNGKKALIYFKKNIKTKNPYRETSLLGIARIYNVGNGVKKNTKECIKYYKRAAKLGNLKAMLELGSMYDEVGDERGVYKSIKKDPKLALKYYYQIVEKNCLIGHYAYESVLKNQKLKLSNQTPQKIKKIETMIKKINSKIINYYKNPPKNDQLDELGLTRDKIINLREMINHLSKLEYLNKDSPEKFKKYISQYNVTTNTAQVLKRKEIDKKEALKIVKKDGYELENLPVHFKKDKEVVLESIKETGGYTLEYADDSLKKDSEVILKALDYLSEALKYADNSLKKDKKFTLEAVKKHWSVLEFVDEIFKKDKEIVLEAVKQVGFALEFAHKSLRKDKEIVLVALKSNVAHYAKHSLVDDVYPDGADHNLRKDPDILAILNKIKK